MRGSDHLNSADDEYDLSYDPPPPPKKSGGLRMFMGIAAVLVVLAGAGFIGSVVLRGNAEAASGADAVRLEPTSFAGANPFVSPVGKDQPVSAVAAGGEFSGATAGLYARNPAIPACDGQQLVAALQADDKRAAAWAQAENIRATDIPAFVAGLTPVLLRADTAVTAFGYDDPAFFSYPAVLQAGTAVLINGRGEPTVKCYNGNPLASRAQPAPTVARTVSYVGPRWTTFRTTSVTVVRPSTTINQTFCVGGTGVGGNGGTGGNGAGAGQGGNGGAGTSGAGCVIVPGKIKTVDCKKHPEATGCTPPPPPVPPTGPGNCTKDPTAPGCTPTPVDPGTPPVDCTKDPKATGCPGVPATPPVDCVKDPKAVGCPGVPATPPVDCAKDPKAVGCPGVPATPPVDCAKDPKAVGCPEAPVTPPVDCVKDPKAIGCPVVAPPVDCVALPTAVGCPAPGTAPAGGNTTPGTGTGAQVDPVQQAPVEQKVDPVQKSEPVEQKVDPVQKSEPVQQVGQDQQAGQDQQGGTVVKKKHSDDD